MRRANIFVFVLAIPVITAGCGDDWGDKISTFVDTEVHGLTAAVAQNELDVRWFDYFNALTAKSILVVGNATWLTDLSKIAAAPLDTFEDREGALALIDAADTNSIEADRMLRSAIVELNGSAAVCEAETALHRVDVSALGSRIATQIILPRGEWFVEVNCEFGTGNNDNAAGSGTNNAKKSDGSGCWKSLVSVITAIFGADKQKQQQDEADKAIARIPSRIVSASEVEQISKQMCSRTAATPLLQDGIASAKAALTRAQQNTLEVSKALAAMRWSIEAQQMPLLLQMVRDKTGIERTARDIATEYQSQRVTGAVDEQRKDLATFEARFQRASTCSELLASYELLRRVVVEKRLQLEAATTANSVYATSFSPLLTTIKVADINFQHQLKAKSSTLCGQSQ